MSHHGFTARGQTMCSREGFFKTLREAEGKNAILTDVEHNRTETFGQSFFSLTPLLPFGIGMYFIVC